MTKVAIVGAGTMGHALALVHALGGCLVHLQDINVASFEAAQRKISQAFRLLMESGLVGGAFTDVADLPITMTTNLMEALQDADLFVEAAAENVTIKQQIFEDADRLASPSCVFSSITSMLDVFPLVPRRRMERFCVVHWYSPPYVIDLVEVAPGPQTDPAVAEWLVELYAGMGKRPIRFDRFFPGYVANRVQTAITHEIMSILDEGLATPQQIDDSLRHGLAVRMAILGHLMRSDFTGLKLVAANIATAANGATASAGTMLHELVALGHEGVASGCGFYDYSDRTPDDFYRDRDLKMIELKIALAGIVPIAANTPPFAQPTTQPQSDTI